jgi:menaquinone-specific isochorismate synthase
LLKHLKDQSPGCYHFCFQFSTNSAFLGATPERLYKRAQRTIKSEAIAGTRPRGTDDAQDQEYENQLLNSPKDLKEHQYVVDTINTALTPLCTALRSENQFSLRKLEGSQHLVTSFEGELKEKVYDQDILDSLHPTPAVAGCPTDTALQTIRELEPFDRGWYAGPVGYVGFHQTEFAVAIRSGLVQGDQLSLYAGAGIVAGSTAQDEWDEIENKISNFIKVFKK